MGTQTSRLGYFIRIVIASGLAVAVVDDLLRVRTGAMRLVLLFVAVIVFRMLIDLVEPAARRFVTGRRPPAA